ncbi:CTD nuclear envelope phosphatase 1 regulatory subunit 1 [Homo sapiens]|uniref:Nuclear envelope phosphatase-regulatory subunit 1 n=2 Tax=Hominidae TaxID=9604 RepID=H3BLY8_HUMAN|nr:CTD nuclear envelope phosphatase 1 regulatory subunit 1 [Homo sapiens]KAI4054818.1 CTD nuclear envelope phosphatase 1 regulatory subunit 1 [Homo sapiens]PNJ62472.1 CNEP1R1 isoform 3 [Pongo abelii]
MNSLEQAEAPRVVSLIPAVVSGNCQDLKAFERRLTEYIHCLQPATGRWRSVLLHIIMESPIFHH